MADGTAPGVNRASFFEPAVVSAALRSEAMQTHESTRILTAELLSVGSELTVGETRDTNAGELAGDLSREGVRVVCMSALPDELVAVADAFRIAAGRADLVVSTGGLGPTPDDLTREAIAAALGETPAVDRQLEGWLRTLWQRRGIDFPEINLKQAWLIPWARAIPNDNGTAPGWWVDPRDGAATIVALPGPPREMRPMWKDWVLPRLRDGGLGRSIAVRTYRLSGIGESALADLLGESILRAANPVVATYARADAVDLRISAVAGGDGDDPSLALGEAEQRILPLVADYVWGRDDQTWTMVIEQALGARGWSIAGVEVGTRGSLATLLGDVGLMRRSEVIADGAPGAPARITSADMIELARGVRERASSEVGIALVARARGRDTRVSVAIVDPEGEHVERRMAFLGGAQGRARAASTAASILFERLRTDRVVSAP
jgi:nicotinamide-nucleotide amidase